jgi:hypothetical protein
LGNASAIFSRCPFELVTFAKAPAEQMGGVFAALVATPREKPIRRVLWLQKGYARR